MRNWLDQGTNEARLRHTVLANGLKLEQAVGIVSAASKLKGNDVVTNIIGAVLRSILVWILVITPSVILTGIVGESSFMVVFIAFLAALFTFVEYFCKYPSIIE